jgi:hypothetical protein
VKQEPVFDHTAPSIGAAICHAAHLDRVTLFVYYLTIQFDQMAAGLAIPSSCESPFTSVQMGNQLGCKCVSEFRMISERGQAFLSRLLEGFVVTHRIK